MAVRLHCWPSEDAAFARLAEETIRRLPTCTPHALEARLRATYPRVHVVARAAVASLDGELWYVYRDGDLVSSVVVSRDAPAARR